ncbi:hypothetical protein BX600DRAFT_498795 [Xylariales sp. PMI_506]|nr:hypothetical protein BX600DRAFT_498795 [Xylariales sp. PMI_506]
MPGISQFIFALSSLVSIYAYPGNSGGKPGQGQQRFCKANPGSPSWPAEETWASFNESLGGRLIRPPPPGAVCHEGQPTYNADECPAVAAAWFTYDFHSANPISNMWNQYNNDSCLPDVTDPCSAAGYPAFAVNASTAEHVQLSLKYAQKNNIRVVIKSSGHDYQGRSTAPGALTIWVHYLQGLQTHDSFQPKGCSFTIEGSAVTVGGGTQMITMYEELDKINQTVVGGGGKTVSVGGYITGGGHSLLAPRYGLAADQVLEIELVTPSGDIVTANECQNEDLFWAMRGGGGSTFGVMTSVTMFTHPSPELVSLSLAFVTTDVGVSWYWDMMGYLLSQLPYLASKGVSGYNFIAPNISNPLDGGQTQVGAFYSIVIIQDTQSLDDMVAIWAPIQQYVNTTWPQAIQLPNATVYPSFLAWYYDHYDTNQAGIDQYVGSHLMPATSFEDQDAIVAAWKPFLEASGGGTAYLVAGAGVQNAKPRGGGDAVCPAWRKALVHATNGVEFAPLDPALRAASLKAVNTALDPIRKLAPNMGAYVNENNPAEPDWQHSFWGDNYDRLVQIKRTVDPEDTLWCHPCVGNERWEEVGYQLCRIEDCD